MQAASTLLVTDATRCLRGTALPHCALFDLSLSIDVLTPHTPANRQTPRPWRGTAAPRQALQIPTMPLPSLEERRRGWVVPPGPLGRGAFTHSCVLDGSQGTTATSGRGRL